MNSSIIDITLGLIAIYITLSLIVSGINEIISGLLTKRAKDLATTIEKMLGDQNLKNEFYNHPLVKSLYDEKKYPSYIPTEIFTKAFISIVLPYPQKKGEELRKTLEALKGPDSTSSDSFYKTIGTWYNSVMQRLTGRYKRWAQKLTILFGLLVVFLLNADSIMIANYLWNDPLQRSETTAIAVMMAAKEGKTINM